MEIELDIRQAHKDDKGPLAELMYSSGSDLYDYLFKTKNHSALEFIQFEFDSGIGFCGYKNVTVAVENDVVGGTACFYDGKAYKRLVSGTVKNVFKFYGPIKSLPIMNKMKHSSSLLKEPRPDELYLSNFGVSPALRGKGVGSLMIESKRAEAKKNAYRIFSLDVAESNPRAEALYSRLGYEVVANKTFSGKDNKVSNVRKMELTL